MLHVFSTSKRGIPDPIGGVCYTDPRYDSLLEAERHPDFVTRGCLVLGNSKVPSQCRCQALGSEDALEPFLFVSFSIFSFYDGLTNFTAVAWWISVSVTLSIRISKKEWKGFAFHPPEHKHEP